MDVSLSINKINSITVTTPSLMQQKDNHPSVFPQSYHFVGSKGKNIVLNLKLAGVKSKCVKNDQHDRHFTGETLMNDENKPEIDENEDEMWKEIDERCEECRGRGEAELLECLEREAIMGDDEGKNPVDYNRRAFIFHKSNSVFQALKDKQTAPSSY